MAAGHSTAGRARDAFGLSYDPTEPINQMMVENEIIRLSHKLENLTDELAGRARIAAESEANHKGRRASEYLKAEGTDAKRSAAADVAAHKLFERRLIEQALYESTKQAILSVRAQLDALRTISANIRAQT